MTLWSRDHYVKHWNHKYLHYHSAYDHQTQNDVYFPWAAGTYNVTRPVTWEFENIYTPLSADLWLLKLVRCWLFYHADAQVIIEFSFIWVLYCAVLFQMNAISSEYSPEFSKAAAQKISHNPHNPLIKLQDTFSFYRALLGSCFWILGKL